MPYNVVTEMQVRAYSDSVVQGFLTVEQYKPVIASHKLVTPTHTVIQRLKHSFPLRKSLIEVSDLRL